MPRKQRFKPSRKPKHASENASAMPGLTNERSDSSDDRHHEELPGSPPDPRASGD